MKSQGNFGRAVSPSLMQRMDSSAVCAHCRRVQSFSCRYANPHCSATFILYIIAVQYHFTECYRHPLMSFLCIKFHFHPASHCVFLAMLNANYQCISRFWLKILVCILTAREQINTVHLVCCCYAISHVISDARTRRKQ